MVVGAPSEDGGGGSWMASGAAYVFYRNWGGADNWGQVTKLQSGNPYDWEYYGSAVAVSGDTIAVGVPGFNLYMGQAFIYQRNEGGGDFRGEVTAPDAF